MDLNNFRLLIASEIEEYLNGRISTDDLIRWAVANTDNKHVDLPQSLDYWIVQSGLWAVWGMSSSEPEEYRTSRDELVLEFKYLTGELPFPGERVPSDNLKGLRQEIAQAIDRYLAGDVAVEDLALLGASWESLIERLELPENIDRLTVQYGLRAIRQARTAKQEMRGPARRNLQLATRYLKGSLSFPRTDTRRSAPPFV